LERNTQLLKVDNVSIWYGDLQIIFDISIGIGDKEIIAVVGGNGAGKTTLLKAISGLIPVKTGTIQFEGTVINDLRSHEIVQLGIIQVPEGKGIFASLTVQENLEMGSYISTAKKRRRESLDKVFNLFPRLKERKGQIAATLSGGEQQMLAIGRGLMSLPRLFLLDEPSMGLSPLLVNTILGVIAQIHREGTAILLVEQNVYHALNISNRAYTLENGSIGLEGEGKLLLNNPYILKVYMGM
jgi:branched-chain amino acid transport system ATP-binding protein